MTQDRYANDTIRNIAGLLQKALARYGEYPADVPGLHLTVTALPASVPCFYTTSVSLVLAGRKRLLVGKEEQEYGSGSMIVAAADIPVAYELLGVSAENRTEKSF